MKRLFLLVLFGCFLAAPTVFGQVDLGNDFHKDKKGKEAFLRAEEYYDRGDYLYALPFYRSLESQYGDSDYLIFRIGICLLYKNDEAEASLEYLQRVKQKNPKAADIDLYLARAYHINEKYDEAIASVDNYLKQKKLLPEKIDEAKRLRQYCLNAKELSSKPVSFKIEPIQGSVNTENSEYVPVISSDDSLMLFTYRGNHSTGGLQAYPDVPDSAGFYFEDVFYTWRENGKWTKPIALDSTINGKGHDACIALSNDGQYLLIYKDDAGNGDIYLSSLQGFYWTAPVPLLGDVNTAEWEGSATFSSDMQTLFFASERPGGYGGRDIYQATRLPDGTWGNVRNLGPTINTPYNEDAPFLHPNNITLMFSSEGHNSMGGYDIFKTQLKPIDSTYSEPGNPENIGYPINTPGDDKYFVLGTDGKHGYYSSGKANGQGQQDIYLISGDFDLEAANVLLLSGIITNNGKPVRASVSVRDQDGKLRSFQIYSNAANGKYLVNLPLGHKYTIVYELADGSDRKTETIDVVDATQMQRKEINVRFGSAATSIVKNDTTTNVVKLNGKLPIDTGLFKVFPLDSFTLALLNPYDYNAIVRFYGNAKKDGLIFRVQIAAYYHPDNYSSSFLLSLGTIDKVILDDQITRFTMGKFDNLADADAYCKRIIAAGQTDAFVTAEMGGKRYLLSELVKLHFFQDMAYFENHPLRQK
jgi:tetratricopeptide (TPR) repeat protein